MSVVEAVPAGAAVGASSPADWLPVVVWVVALPLIDWGAHSPSGWVATIAGLLALSWLARRPAFAREHLVRALIDVAPLWLALALNEPLRRQIEAQPWQWALALWLLTGVGAAWVAFVWRQRMVAGVALALLAFLAAMCGERLIFPRFALAVLHRLLWGPVLVCGPVMLVWAVRKWLSKEV